MTPLLTGAHLNVHHNLVHAVRGGDVDLTMVRGKVVVEDGRLRSADLQALIDEVNALAPGLFERRDAWLAGHQAVKRQA
jgi:5-methylthioadenosine/S-adenosylhomocysteine deaminase